MAVQLTRKKNTKAISFSQIQANLQKAILLDSQSTINSFCEPSYVGNRRKIDNPITLATNAGEKDIDEQADVQNFGTVYFDEDGMTNIFSLAAMEDQFRVTYDSAVESAFHVHTPNRIIKFKRSQEGLYYMIPNSPQAGRQFLETVSENKTFYTDRQKEDAKRARALLHTLSCPSIAELKKIITMNGIGDCPVTVEHIKLAEQIYGKDIASLKGKTTRRTPDEVVDDIVAIPPELTRAQKHVELFVDIFYVNGITFLSTLSRHIKYRTATHILDRTVKQYTAALSKLFALYEKANFVVTKITADREFKPILETFPKLDLNLASALEHVPAAEKNNRDIQDLVRSTFHSTPFKALPNTMTIWLVEETAKKMNYFPVKGGVSQYFSPRHLLHQKKLDYAKHCKIPQFAFVQAHDEPDPSNTQVQRTLDALYISPTENAQLGYRLLNLSTGRPITRRKVTTVPMPDWVISLVEHWAKTDKKKALVISTRTGHIFYDSSWTAGVDYTHETLEDDPYRDEDYKQESDTDDSYNSEDYEDEDLEQQEREINAPDATEPTVSPRSVTKEDDTDQSDSDESEQETTKRTTSAVPLPDTWQGNRTSSGRRVKPTNRLIQQYTQTTNVIEEYTPKEARVMATLIDLITSRIQQHKEPIDSNRGIQHLVTYTLKQGLKKFGEPGMKAAMKEMTQLHDRECFEPIDFQSLSQREKKKALESLIFLVQKKDGTIKARTCANGSVQREWMSKEYVSSPTVSTEAILMTSIIDAEEGRDVATCDIPNAFIQTEVQERDKDGDRTIMKIRGVLVDLLCEIDPVYKKYVRHDKRGKILYVKIVKAIYGMLVSAMLFYKKLTKDLEQYGFKTNPYDPCVANKMVNGHQMTVCWHVDDLKISHKDPKQVTDFLKWVTDTYGQYGEVKTTRDKLHTYLGMTLDFRIKGQVTIDMRKYIDEMEDNFPKKYLQGAPPKSPWTDDLFNVDPNSPLLNNDMKEQFHTTTAQGLFLTKRARPDIGPAIAFCTTRVREPTEQDWDKLVRMMKFLIHTREDRLTLQADGTRNLYWHVDASFAVHPDYKSHTGATFSMGKGTATHLCKKQSLNTRSSTEAELVAADDAIGPLLWHMRFLEHQGYPIKDNKLYQDNRSAILLESNGRKSAGKRSRHLNVRFFFITDQKEKKNLSIHYCPTDDMLGDYYTKPTHGSKYRGFRDQILNLSATVQLFTMSFIIAGAQASKKA